MILYHAFWEHKYTGVRLYPGYFRSETNAFKLANIKGAEYMRKTGNYVFIKLECDVSFMEWLRGRPNRKRVPL